MWQRIIVRLAIAGAVVFGFIMTSDLWWRHPIAISADVAPPATTDTGDGTFTIVILGTSLTARYDWPAQLGRRLSRCFVEPVRVIPIARGAATSRWGSEQLARVATPNPDLVLVEFAINDADLRRGLSLTDSARLHRRILREISERVPEAQVVLMSMSPAWGLRRLLRPRLTAYYALYPELAAESGAGFIDLFRRWMAKPDVKAAFSDGVHPTRQATTEIIIPALTNYILATKARSVENCSD